jgi:hypothetical protein
MSRVLIALTAAFVLSAASVAFSQSNPSDPSTNTNSSGSVTQPQGKTGPLNTKSVGGAPASSPQSLTWRPGSLNHVFGDTRLRDCKPELKQFTMDTRRSPQRVLDAHLPDKRLQLRVDLRPVRCQRTTVSGWTIVRTFKIDGNHRYSWIKNQRSLFVSRTRPCILRRKTIKLMSERCIFCLKPALRLEWRGKMASTKHSSAIMVRRR